MSKYANHMPRSSLPLLMRNNPPLPPLLGYSMLRRAVWHTRTIVSCITVAAVIHQPPLRAPSAWILPSACITRPVHSVCLASTPISCFNYRRHVADCPSMQIDHNILFCIHSVVPRRIHGIPPGALLLTLTLEVVHILLGQRQSIVGVLDLFSKLVGS
jgi:hypothetical protein